jgi:hypothetical protein
MGSSWRAVAAAGPPVLSAAAWLVPSWSWTLQKGALEMVSSSSGLVSLYITVPPPIAMRCDVTMEC